MINSIDQRATHSVATGSRYCCYAPVLHGFVLWSVRSWFKAGKAWSGRHGKRRLWRITCQRVGIPNYYTKDHIISCDRCTSGKFYSFVRWITWWQVRTRGTPRVQFANIRKMVLCQGLPHCLGLCVDPCMARNAQSLNSSLHAWLQNLEAF